MKGWVCHYKAKEWDPPCGIEMAYTETKDGERWWFCPLHDR